MAIPGGIVGALGIDPPMLAIEGKTPVFHDTIVNARDGCVIEQWNAVQTVVGTDIAE